MPCTTGVAIVYPVAMSEPVYLYTREGCGLCQQASAMAAAVGVETTPLDISRSVDLLERYGNSIPVISFGDQELFWPFTPDDIRALTAP